MKNVDIKLAQTQQDFQEFYKKNLREIYTNLEPVRRKKIKTFYRRLIISAAINGGLILLCATGYIDQKIYTTDGFIKCWIFLGLVCGYLLYEPFSDYRTTTKKRVMDIILSFWGNFSYCHERDIIGQQSIERAELFHYFNQCEVDDAFSGSYNNVAMTVSEHDLRIKGNKGDTKIFKGIFILLNFPKKFKGKTVVLNKSRNINFIFNNPLLMLPLLAIYAAVFLPLFFIHKAGFEHFSFSDLIFCMAPMVGVCLVFAVFYLIIKKKHPREATQKVALEGLPFMRRWKVLTDNQIEARYILTPVLMEKILEVKHFFHGRNIDFSFFDNRLLIAIHTSKNMFETTSLFTPALSYHKVREVISQLHAIFSVIDVLQPTAETKDKKNEKR